MKTRRINSVFNGKMEVTFRDGRKVLDSANANYSYGSAAGVWKSALTKVDLSEVKSILLLGLGGGTILEILHEHFGYAGKITAVEIDAVIIQLAKEEFGVEENGTIEIHCMDAFEYVTTKRKQFDLVLVDISIDYTIPEQIQSLVFWTNAAKRVKHNGTIIFNALNYNKTLSPVFNELEAHGFELKMYKRVRGTNNILVARKG